jgi:hypothetical protein
MGAVFGLIWVGGLPSVDFAYAEDRRAGASTRLIREDIMQAATTKNAEVIRKITRIETITAFIAHSFSVYPTFSMSTIQWFEYPLL